MIKCNGSDHTSSHENAEILLGKMYSKYQYMSVDVWKTHVHILDVLVLVILIYSVFTHC